MLLGGNAVCKVEWRLENEDIEDLRPPIFALPPFEQDMDEGMSDEGSDWDEDDGFQEHLHLVPLGPYPDDSEDSGREEMGWSDGEDWAD